MKEYGNLVDGTVIYASEYMTDISNPTNEFFIERGWKEIVRRNGNGGAFIDGQLLIIESQSTNISPKDIREQSYENEPIIMWDGKLRTCDSIRGLIRTYELLSDTERVEQLIVLWLAGREEIKTKYPDLENL